MMKESVRTAPSSRIGWFGGGVAAALAIWALARPEDNRLKADEGSSVSSETLAVVKEAGEGSQVLYLLDTTEKTLSVYHYDTRKGKLRFAAGRHLAADQQLLEFNNEEPHVSDIEKLVRSK